MATNNNRGNIGKSLGNSTSAATTAPITAAPSTAPSNKSIQIQPLSWNVARSRLRHVLERYIDDPPPRQKSIRPVSPEADNRDSDPNKISTTTRTRATRLQVTISEALSWWIEHDLDLYLGSFLFSVALLVMACLSLASTTETTTTDLHHPASAASITTTASTNPAVYRSQVAASCLLVFGSVTSCWMIQRRRFLGLNDSNNAKRREINRFLRAMKAHDYYSVSRDDTVDNDKNGTSSSSAGTGSSRRINKSSRHHATLSLDAAVARFLDHVTQNGQQQQQEAPSMNQILMSRLKAASALVDIYPVYRISSLSSSAAAVPPANLHHSSTPGETVGSNSNNSNNDETSTLKTIDAAWSRLPSLLLVQGDYIALQIGDIAPADCVLVDNDAIRIPRGHRLSLEDVVMVPTTAPSAMGGEGTPTSLTWSPSLADAISATLPRGRTTLAPGVDHFLTLCNRTQIFAVAETPLEEFLRRPPTPPKSSQVARQISAMRKALTAFAFLLLVVTALIVLSRPDVVKGDLSLILPLPLLAAIGVLPVVAPACSFFLEVLGTARILTTVHLLVKGSPLGRNPDSKNVRRFHRTRLLIKYFVSTALSRLALWDLAFRIFRIFEHCGLVRSGGQSGLVFFRSELIRIPPASVNLLEKMGVVTAFALVDDELVCEPHSIPQQLLLPSGQGLKLLDICPTYDDDNSEEDGSGSATFDSLTTARKRGKSFDSDSESEEGETTAHNFHALLRRKILRRREMKRLKSKPPASGDDSEGSNDSFFEVQFEDPSWWQHLPSLKCIGLACLLVDESRATNENKAIELAASTATRHNRMPSDRLGQSPEVRDQLNLADAKSSLGQLVCDERRSRQLQSLAQCIGFSTDLNQNGQRGDISPFTERMRLHVLSNTLFQDRLMSDAHERSSEQSRWWGLIRPDSTSIIVQDNRTNAYQLLTIGDPSVISSLCNEAWQGEISTILPFTALDRRTIAETTTSWKLADLDVAAFSYSPVPRTLEARLARDSGFQIYLVDHPSRGEKQSILKDKGVSDEWSFIRNQIFLGVLGSLVVPRREIQKLLGVLNEAGVRFVYFSPRNMRRQKELASQMGIDVAWNCAISLRPLKSGEEDPHRMVSNYADWSVNAKLPHGIEDVRKHLKEVDNVPLLVSLFTDVTKSRTREMVEVFQEYSDNVIAIGLAHLPRNHPIFSTADIAVGIDILTEEGEDFYSFSTTAGERGEETSGILPAELEFVSSISSHTCAFRFRGASSISYISTIIARGRAALEAAVSAALFAVTGCVSFSLYVLFSVCTPSTTIPYVPTLGAVLFLQIALPILGLAMAMSDGDDDIMKRVPPKNDKSFSFGRQEGWKLYRSIILKALPPAFLPQICHLIAFGELIIDFEPELVIQVCGQDATSWWNVIRCHGLRDYSGSARTASGNLVLAEFVCCITVASAGFVSRFASLQDQLPTDRNHVWLVAVVVILGLTVGATAVAVDNDAGAALPWYYYILAIVMPFLCLLWVEVCKRPEIKLERRAEKLRRLQFETRLGAWSPK